jgi:PAS domain S-box-containing protein
MEDQDKNTTLSPEEEIAQLRKRVAELERQEVTREKLQDFLRDSEQSYKRLVHYLTDYIYTVFIQDGEVVYTYHGPGCQAVTGYASKDYLENPGLWFEMVYEDDREMVRKYSEQAQRGIEVPPFEHRIYHRDGSIRWIKNTIVIHYDEDGNVVSYDGLINNITELKRIEKEKKQQQQQLIQADKMASLGVLVAGVAHEINNPNNFILLNGQFLSDAWKNIRVILDEYYNDHGNFDIAGIPYSESRKNITEALAGIIDGSVRIKKIVNNLKTFSRKDTGDLSQLVDINQVVKSAVTLSNNMLHTSTYNFILQLGEGLPTVRGNSQQLEQVVINLLTNACHALSDPNQKIILRTLMINDDKEIAIVVQDEGVGIDEKYQQSVFDPFFTTKQDREGTGLGLSISYQIIKNHGGSIELESQLNNGTTVTVYLPVAN